MNEKRFNGRFTPKGDIEANWNKAVGFIPLDKEIIIYKPDENHSAARFKVGDGKTVVQDLPFSGTDIEAIEKLIDEKGELLVEYVDNAVAAIESRTQQIIKANNKAIQMTIKTLPQANGTKIDFNTYDFGNFSKIDWGDGTVNTELIHNYPDSNKTYYCTIYDVSAISSTCDNQLDRGDGLFLIKEVVIPKSITLIGQNSFFYWTGLTSVVIPDSVTSIGEKAFAYCNSLTSVVIPNSVTSIGKDAFHGCSGLTSMAIPDSVTSIGEGAFDGCSGLTSVIIPDSVTTIGEYAFNSCKSLANAVISNKATSIDSYAFCNCKSLTSVVIPDSVTSIGNNAFHGCSSLTSIEIPDSVTSIGKWAFAYCNRLTSVVIGKNIASIGNYAFKDCLALKNVVFKNSTPIDYNSSEPWFYGTLLANIYVPYGCKQAYINKWNAEGAWQYILDKIVESDREAMMSDLIQPDWNQNDCEQLDYIKNRICYYETKMVTYDMTKEPFLNVLQGSFNHKKIPFRTADINLDLMIVRGNNYIMIIENDLPTGHDIRPFEISGTEAVNKGYIWQKDGNWIAAFSNPRLNSNHYSHTDVHEIDVPEQIIGKTIDEAFISDSIARTSDIAQLDKRLGSFETTLPIVLNQFSSAIASKLDIEGGAISGDLSIGGDLTVAGTTTTQDTETVLVKNNIVVTNSDGLELIEPGGFAIKTDTTNAYGIMYDPNDDGVKIGLGTFDENGKFEYTEGEDQFLATRADTIADGHTVVWDDNSKQLVDSGVSATDYIKNTDTASTTTLGLMMVGEGLIGSNSVPGKINIRKAEKTDIDAKTNGYKPITPVLSEYTTMKCLTDVKDTTLWTDDTTGENGEVVKGTKTKARELLNAVGFDNIAKHGVLGVVAASNTYCVQTNTSGTLICRVLSNEEYQKATNAAFIAKGTLDNVLNAGFVARNTNASNIVYGKEGGVEKVYDVSVSPVESTIVRRGTDGNIAVTYPNNDSSATSKAYVAAKYVAKAEYSNTPGTSGTDGEYHGRVYAFKYDGTEETVPMANQAKNYSICWRDANANIYVGDPTQQLHCINKRYAEANFAAKPATTSGFNRVYGINNGTTDVAYYNIMAPAQFSTEESAKSRAGVAYYTNGRLGCAPPEGDYEAVNRKYVDENTTKIYKHSITINGDTIQVFTANATPYTNENIMTIGNDYLWAKQNYSQIVMLEVSGQEFFIYTIGLAGTDETIINLSEHQITDTVTKL